MDTLCPIHGQAPARCDACAQAERDELARELAAAQARARELQARLDLDPRSHLAELRHAAATASLHAALAAARVELRHLAARAERQRLRLAELRAALGDQRVP